MRYGPSRGLSAAELVEGTAESDWEPAEAGALGGRELSDDRAFPQFEQITVSLPLAARKALPQFGQTELIGIPQLVVDISLVGCEVPRIRFFHSLSTGLESII